MKKATKILVLVLCAVLLVCGTAAGTMAYLTAKTETVTNTFTVGNINIDLKEHDLGADGKLTDDEVEAENSYKVLPGTEQPKDPFVRVKADSEDCWVFVQIKEENNTTADGLKYVTWEIDGEIWTQLGTAENGISTYYKTTNYTTDAAADMKYNVLKDKTVSYSEDLTKEMIDNLAEKQPKLIFKGFAVQLNAAANAATAWNQIPAAERLS